MIKKWLLTISAAAMLSACATTGSSSHGFVASIPADRPSEDIFRVNINQVDGKLSTTGPNHRADAGPRVITVSLIFNPDWGQSMQYTRTQTYSQDISIDVEAGKTYWIGAKVDTRASAEAQRDGSFWEAMVVETR